MEWSRGSNFTLECNYPVVSALFLKRLSFLHLLFLTPLLKIGKSVMVYFWTPNSFFPPVWRCNWHSEHSILIHWSVYLSEPQYHTDLTASKNLKLGSESPPTLFFFCNIVFIILSPLKFLFYFFKVMDCWVFLNFFFYKLTPSLYLIPTNFRLWHTALFLELRMVVWHIAWTQPILILELMRVAKKSRNKPKTFTIEFLFLSSQALWGKNHN